MPWSHDTPLSLSHSWVALFTLILYWSINLPILFGYNWSNWSHKDVINFPLLTSSPGCRWKTLVGKYCKHTHRPTHGGTDIAQAHFQSCAEVMSYRAMSLTWAVFPDHLFSHSAANFSLSKGNPGHSQSDLL